MKFKTKVQMAQYKNIGIFIYIYICEKTGMLNVDLDNLGILSSDQGMCNYQCLTILTSM